MRFLPILLYIIILPCLGHTQPDNKIVIGTKDTLWSATLKETRRYWVYTPPSYSNKNYLPQKYPVLYLLDGDAHFESVSGILQFLGTGINGNYVIPEMIVVAILNTDRTRDLTPTHVSMGPDGKEQPFLKTSGGMDHFFTFLKNELIPHIDSAYSTSPFRIFVGHSLGGIAVINALYKIPETFNAYIALDPSLWYDNQVLLKKAKDYFSKATLPNKFLCIAQANTIQPGDTTRNLHFESMLQFNSIMENYNQSGLHYKYNYYTDDDHGSVPMIAEYDALRYIFKGYKFSFAQALENPAYLKDHYKDFSSKMGSLFMATEPIINTMGYQALQTDTAKAIAFFQMNIDLYPESFNVYDSMGEAWMKKGDFKKAIDYYEKSVALNPGNQNGIDMIKKMKEKKK